MQLARRLRQWANAPGSVGGRAATPLIGAIEPGLRKIEVERIKRKRRTAWMPMAGAAGAAVHLQTDARRLRASDPATAQALQLESD
jgi:predicted metalloprotease